MVERIGRELVTGGSGVVEATGIEIARRAGRTDDEDTGASDEGMTGAGIWLPVETSADTSPDRGRRCNGGQESSDTCSASEEPRTFSSGTCSTNRSVGVTRALFETGWKSGNKNYYKNESELTKENA